MPKLRPLPVTEQAAERILSLPLSPHLDDDQIKRVCASLASAVDQVVDDGGRGVRFRVAAGGSPRHATAGP